MEAGQVLEKQQDRTEHPRTAHPGSRTSKTIPRPLVQTNRTFLVLSIGLALFVHKVLLVIPLLVGVISLVFHWNPVIAFSRRFLRKPPSEYRREDPLDQRFNQTIATTLLALSVSSFVLGAPILGYIASGMVIMAAGVALIGFCVGCYLRFRIQQWKYKREQPSVLS